MSLYRSFCLCFALGVFFAPCSSKAQVLSESAPDWSGDNIHIDLALSKIAYDLASKANPPVLIKEGWNNLIVMESRPRSGYVMGLNPLVSRFRIQFHGQSYARILDEITSKSGDLSWQMNLGFNTIQVAEAKLLADPRWPLNARLGSRSDRTYTYFEARELLVKSFNLIADDESAFLCPIQALPAMKSVIVWSPGKLSDPAVRDFVHAIAVELHRAGGVPKSAWHVLRAVPDGDPRLGYSSFADRPVLKWVGTMESAMSAAEVDSQALSLDNALKAQQRDGGEVPNFTPEEVQFPK